MTLDGFRDLGRCNGGRRLRWLIADLWLNAVVHFLYSTTPYLRYIRDVESLIYQSVMRCGSIVYGNGIPGTGVSSLELEIAVALSDLRQNKYCFS